MIRTERGRVVYDRKVHTFTCKDLVRVGKGLADTTSLSAQARGFNEILSNYFSEQAVGFSEWLDWLAIGINFFGTTLVSPRFRIRGSAERLKGWQLVKMSQAELVLRYAARLLRDEADTIEGI